MAGTSGKNQHLSFPVTKEEYVSKLIIAGGDLLQGKNPRRLLQSLSPGGAVSTQLVSAAIAAAKQPVFAHREFGVPHTYKLPVMVVDEDRAPRKKKEKKHSTSRPRVEGPPPHRKGALVDKYQEALKRARERNIQSARANAHQRRMYAVHGGNFFEAQAGVVTRGIRTMLEGLGSAVGDGFVDALQRGAPGVASACTESVIESAEGVVKDHFSSMVERVKGAVARAQSMVQEVFESHPHVSRLVCAIVGIGLPLWFFYGLFKWTGLSTVVVSALSRAFGVEMPEFEEQFGESGETEAIGRALFAAALTAMIPSDKSSARMWSPFVALVTKASPFVSGAKGMVDWVLDGIQWLINVCLRLVGSGEIQWFQRRLVQVDQWMVRSHEYLQAEHHIPPEEIVRHFSDGHDLAKTAIGSVVKQDIDSMLRQLTSKWNLARGQRALMQAARPEPICIVLHGKPGVGKSISMDYFHEFITVKTNTDIRQRVIEEHEKGCEYSLQSHAYTKDAGKFWAGYNPAQHTTLMVDDGGTRLPGAGSEDTDFINLMRIVNSAPVSLDMPDVESKGNVFFRSPLVLVSTNLDAGQWHAYASKAISNPDALIRRLKLFLTMTIQRPEMRKPDGKLDVQAWQCASPDVQDTTWRFAGTWDGARVSFDSMRAVAEFASAKMLEARGHFLAMSANTTRRALTDALGLNFEAQSGMTDEDVARGMEIMKDPEHEDMMYRTAVKFGGLADRRHAVETMHSLLNSGANSWWARCLGRTFMTLALAMTKFQEWVQDKATLLDFVAIGFVVGTILQSLILLIGAGVRALYSFFFPGKKPACEPQSQDPTSVMDNVTANMYAIGLGEPGQPMSSRLGAILFVCREFALMPHHFLVHLQKLRLDERFKDMVPTIKSMGLGTQLQVAWETFMPTGENVHVIMGDDGSWQDLCLVKIGGRAHRNIVGSFMHYGTRRPLDLGWVKVSDDLKPRWENDFHGVEYTDKFVYGDQAVHRAVTYRRETAKGDCGSTIVSQGACGRVYVVGIHVAGSVDHRIGVAGLVFQEQLDRAIAKLDVAVRRLVVTSASHTTEKFVPQVDDLGRLSVALTTLKNGVRDSPDAPPSMVPAPITHGWSKEVYTHNKVPADCSEAATERALQEYTKPCIFQEHDMLISGVAECAARIMLDDVGMPSRLNTRLPTNEEAVLGRAFGEKFAEPINRRTSSGYPWQNMGYTKARMFDESTGDVLLGSVVTREIFREADDLLSSLLEGNASSLEHVLFKVSPKREMRARGKDPRVIQGAPLHLVIVFRRLFWAFMGHFASWAPEKELAIGLDPARHWTDLYNWLVELSPSDEQAGECGAGDYKRFDQCQEVAISRAIGRAIVERYKTNSPYDVARELAWRTVCGPRIVFRNVVYQLHKGMPSGHPCTSIANGMYNGVLFRMSYASVRLSGSDEAPFAGAPRVEVERIMREFRGDVRLSVCGDDNIFTTRECKFNEMELSRVMGRFGARYTMDVKDGVAVRPFRPFKEVSYLGRGFRFETALDKWVAPLRLESVALIGQYAEKESQIDTVWYKSTGLQILEELSQHPQCVWDEWMPHFKKAFRDTGLVPYFIAPPGVESERIKHQPKSLLPGDEE